MRDGALQLFLSGDVMLGRGIDQILPRPGSPELREEWVRDARTYVRLAEKANGPLERPAEFVGPWGDALSVLDDAAPDVRVINLETAVTRSADFARAKAVCYRMSPENVPAVSVVKPDVCVLANNHVLDFGPSGLEETLDVLAAAGLPVVGAGHDAQEAARAVVVGMPAGGRVVVHAFAAASSGVPPTWAAASADAVTGTPSRPGVNLVGSLTRERAEGIAARVRRDARPGDVVVVSIHWGSNWGYEVPQEQVAFAHALIDGGVDVVHGHSSHHPRPIEVYRGRLVLYGCGDLVNDYEGIAGHEEFRSDLRLLYLASLDPADGAFLGLRMVPMRARRLRLERASAEQAGWLAANLARASRPFGCGVGLGPAGDLYLEFGIASPA